MATVRSKTFKSGNSEAVRLPKEVAYGAGVELVIVRNGDVMTIYPAQSVQTPLQKMLEQLEKLPKPDSIEERDTEEIPERPGL